MILLTTLALLGSCTSEPVSERSAPSPQSRLARAAFAHGKVWVVREDGSLTSFSEADDSPSVHALGERVIDLCSDGRGLWAIASGTQYTLHSWQGGQWRRAGQIEKGDDFLLGLGCEQAGPLLVTNRKLIPFGRAGAASTPLTATILPRENTPIESEAGPLLGVVYLTEGETFLGLDMGEWGGGLRRIDRRTGRVETVEQIDGELCDGALNTQCDRVQAIAPIPWQDACLAIAIDVGHGGSGRVTRVCGNRAEQILAVRDAMSLHRPDLKDDWRRGSFGSTPFLGAVASGDDLILAGGNGLYKLNARGVAYLGWPGIRTVGDLSVSFAIPGAVLLAQNWNAEYSFYETVRLIPRPL